MIRVARIGGLALFLAAALAPMARGASWAELVGAHELDASEHLESLLREAARGEARAQHALAARLAEPGPGQNLAEARKWRELAAEQGHAEAQYILGGMYARGEGAQTDARVGFAWRLRAAEQGYAKAQNQVGYQLSLGLGATQDRVAAVRWYRRAAEQGDPWGQYNLGLAYFHGNGAPQDAVQAARWFRLAAGQSDAAAQHMLARLHMTGEGVAQSDVMALAWLDIAISEGEKVDAVARERFADGMTAYQKVEAHRIVREWMNRYGF